MTKRPSPAPPKTRRMEAGQRQMALDLPKARATSMLLLISKHRLEPPAETAVGDGDGDHRHDHCHCHRGADHRHDCGDSQSSNRARGRHDEDGTTTARPAGVDNTLYDTPAAGKAVSQAGTDGRVWLGRGRCHRLSGGRWNRGDQMSIACLPSQRMVWSFLIINVCLLT